MGFLVCDKCEGYYELQEGESSEDFSNKCECGGELKYVENLKDINKGTEETVATITCPECGTENPADTKICKSCKALLKPIESSPETPKKSKALFGRLKGWWDKQNKPIKVTSIVGLFCVGVLITFGIIGMFSANNTGFQTYNAEYMSFQYPNGWYVDKEALGIVILKETSTKYTSNQHSLGVKVYPTKDSVDTLVQLGFPPGKALKTGNINGISYNYTDNYNNRTNVKANLYYYFFEKNGKYVFIQAAVNDTSIAEKVILTFN